jgi:hypothetical protein
MSTAPMIYGSEGYGSNGYDSDGQGSLLFFYFSHQSFAIFSVTFRFALLFWLRSLFLAFRFKAKQAKKSVLSLRSETLFV